MTTPDAVYASADDLTDHDQHNTTTTSNSDTPSPILPSSVQYFYGRITRTETEEFLRGRGKGEGSFLLRESMSPCLNSGGNYAISVLHKSEVLHYLIQKQKDGRYRIPDGKLTFCGPVELLYYYWFTADGFLTPLTDPCNRHANEAPVAFRGIAYDQLEEVLQLEAKKLNIHLDSRVLSPTRDVLLKRLTPILHLYMPWFHGNIPREVAELRLQRDGLTDGKFLLRSRSEKGTFAITLSYEGIPRHYLITQRKSSHFAIEDGPEFDCLIMLVENYHNKSDGLACRLKVACSRPPVYDFEQPTVHTSCAGKVPPPGDCPPPDYTAASNDATKGMVYMEPNQEPGPPDYNDCVFEKTYSEISIDMPSEKGGKEGHCSQWLHKLGELKPCGIAKTIAREMRLRTYFPLYLFFFLLLVVTLVLVLVFV